MASETQAIEVRLAGFAFPRALPDDRANFRFLADLRYLDKAGNLKTEHAVLPGMDTYWECAQTRSAEANFVRGGADPLDGRRASFDLARIDPWDALVLVVQARALHSIQLTVFDVNRRDAWRALGDVAAAAVSALLGRAAREVRRLSEAAEELAGPALGAAADTLESSLLRRLAEGSDDILWKGSSHFERPGRRATPAFKVPSDLGLDPYAIEGQGTAGSYRLELEVRVHPL